MSPFHYAFKVSDLEATRSFYVQVLGCREGRSAPTWIDFDFFGHQLSAHLSGQVPQPDFCGQSDGVRVPIPHFGAVLRAEAFHRIRAALEAHAVAFVIAPYLRYPGGIGEQWTMFFLDPSGNAIELKAPTASDGLFAPDHKG
ncbi:MAG TPA: VOC family protein [Xanthomonadaceae bacterium]|nr:VOC family protein [Xanthomonadaceae bacterium]